MRTTRNPTYGARCFDWIMHSSLPGAIGINDVAGVKSGHARSFDWIMHTSLPGAIGINDVAGVKPGHVHACG
jgi:hypothetical protein